MLKISLFSFILILLLHTTLWAQFQPQANSDSLKKYLNFLGSDKLQGRGTGSPGLQKAAAFISDHLHRWQLKPAGDNNTYFQHIPMHGSLPLPQSTLELHFEKERIYLNLSDDFLLIKTGVQTFIPKPVSLVFAGYGIVAPEYDYNDYLDLDVSNKIVVVLDGEPWYEDNKGFFKGNDQTLYALAESKIRTAISRGAIGTVIIKNATEQTAFNWQKKKIEYSFEDVSLPAQVTSHLGVLLNPDKNELLFKNAPFSYQQLIQKEKEHKLVNFDLNLKMGFNGVFTHRQFKSQNVVAVKMGMDDSLHDSYVVIGAHYDHLGIGIPVNGDSIYNGVMDNAVGTAVLLELARLFSRNNYAARRSVVFVFFCGEEKGLLGSSYYTDHPYAPLYKTIGMVNVDGLSAMGKFLSIIPLGGNYSGLGRILEELAAENGLKVEQIPSNMVADESFNRSDQVSFAQSGIPSILLLEGFLYETLSRSQALEKNRKWFENIYHTPFDDLKQPLDYNAIRRYTDLLYAYCNRLLNISETPQWNENAPFRYKFFQNKAEKR
ncbi:MAG: M28 family peptidase [Calditrichae bacterium]|nr:M28 family peptidase [Calditrichia bacterium]